MLEAIISPPSSGSGTVRYRHGVRKTFQADAARSLLNWAINSTRSANDGYVDFHKNSTQTVLYNESRPR